MPYYELPNRGVTLYYCVNPTSALSPYSPDSEPTSVGLDPNKPIVVLLHGNGLSAASFAAQFNDARLKDAFNLVAIDSRLNGRTKALEREACKFEDIADDIVLLLDHLAFDSYAVFGESLWGSRLATWITVKRSDKVSCLLLSSPGAPDGRTPPSKERSKADMAEALVGKGAHGPLSQKFCEAVATLSFGSEARYAGRRAEYMTWLEYRYGEGRTPYDANRTVIVLNSDRDISDSQLAEINCPVLILQGSADTTAPISETMLWKSSLSGVPGGADVQVIVGASNILTMCEPSILNRMLITFVTRSLDWETRKPTLKTRK